MLGSLPKSYYLPDVTLSGDLPYAKGGFADTWKGQRNGVQVCVKEFWNVLDVNRIKRVRDNAPA